jgi:hypothetical protein
MKFVKIKFLLGKRFCRQQGASHTRSLHISSGLPASRAGEALLSAVISSNTSTNWCTGPTSAGGQPLTHVLLAAQ